jgi:hypothetical protein
MSIFGETKTMGNIGFENLKPLGLALRDAFGLNTFVETGTYKGQTSGWAADHFSEVITIEAHLHRYNKTVAGLAYKKPNIRFVFGDSAEELPKVIYGLQNPAMFWLDAHKYYMEPGIIATECPLLTELTAIKESGIRHFILIDDAKFFTEPPPLPFDATQWPTFDQIRALLPADYETIIWNDAIISVPGEAVPVLRRFTGLQKMDITVLASNNYAHCLPPFAYLFNKFFPGQSVKIVRYDIRPRGLPGNFTNIAIGKQADYSWSGGLIKYLYGHLDDFILLMLEDYFLSQPVNVHAVRAAWGLMLENPQIAKIDLTDDRLKVDHADFDNTFIQSAGDAPFQTSVQAAIWRKDFLLQFLDPTETPWQFERRGTKRVIAARQAGEFGGLILGFKQPPMAYVNAVGGEGNKPGEWDFKKIPGWMQRECNLV